MNNAAIRRVNLVKLLITAETPINGDVLGTRFGVNRRTIERDIRKLEDLGYKFSRTFGPSGGYKMLDPKMDVDYVLCEKDKDYYFVLEKMESDISYQDERTKRFLKHYREVMIREVFS